MKPLSLLVFALLPALLLLPGIPTPARGEGEALLQRTHPVHALVDGRAAARAPMLGLGLRAQSFLGTQPGMAEDDEEEPDVRSFEPGEILDLLRALVPGLGEAEGEFLEIEDGQLRLTTTPTRHEKVKGLLQSLWAEAVTRVEVKIHRVRIPPEALAKLAPAEMAMLRRASVPSDKLPELERALVGAGARTEVASTLVRPGQRAVIGQMRRAQYLRDYDVEIAQDSIVGDPSVDTLVTGWALEVRPFLLERGAVLLEVFGQSADAAQPFRKLSLETEPFGAIELPLVHVLRATTRSRVLPDAARVILLQEDPERGLEAFFASTRVDVGTRARTGRLRMDVSALVTPREERALFAHQGDPGFWTREPWPVEEVAPAFDDERLVATVLAQTAPGLWDREGAWLGLQDHGYLVALADEATRSQVRGLLLELEKALLSSLRARIVLTEVFPDGSRRTAASVALDVPVRGRVVWQAGFESAFLADWGVEVAQEARVGDPIVETLFAGLELELSATPSPIGDQALVSLDVRLSDADLPFEVERPGNECTGPIEAPRTRTVGAVQDLLIQIGRSGSVSLGRLDDGRELILECSLAR